MPHIIQSIIIPKKIASKAKAIKYIKDNYKFLKIDETKNDWRFRQAPPLAKYKYYIHKLPNGVEEVIGYY